MKKIVFFLIAAFLLSNTCFSQQKNNGKVFYEISLSTPDFNKLDKNIPKERRDKIINYFKEAKNVVGVLNFLDQESIYSLEDNGVKNEAEKKLNFTRIFSGSKDVYYHNFETKKIIRETNSEELYLVERKPLKWQLTQESKKIGNYTCFKAIYQYESVYQKKPSKPTIVCYTMEIPVSFGPDKYAGLPGLVIRVEDNPVVLTPLKLF